MSGSLCISVMGDSTGEILLGVVSSVAALLSLAMVVLMCSWCFGGKSSDDDSDDGDEESSNFEIFGQYKTSTDKEPDVRMLNKRSMRDGPQGSGQQGVPLTSKSTIK